MATVPDQLSLSVLAIEGIGRTIAAQLNEVGFYTVADLLRSEASQIHEAISGPASVEQVRGWTQMAAFLQVRGMTPKWAEALHRAEVFRVADLRFKDLSSLRKLFRKAKTEKRIAVSPTETEMSGMLQDAAVLELTGALTGTILDERERPVAGAQLRVGKQEGVTDDRGRFRILRIPLWTTPPLLVTHPQHRPARFRLKHLHPSFVIHSEDFHVRTAAGGRARKPKVLLQVRGDLLPPVGDGPISSRQVERDQIRDGDILAVVESSPDRMRVKLVSKLLVFEEGRFWFPNAWFPAADVPDGTKPGDSYLMRGGSLMPIGMSREKLRMWPAMLRTKRRIAGHKPTDLDHLGAWFEESLEGMRGTGALRRKRGT